MMRRKKPAFTRILFIVFTLVVGLAVVSTWLMIVRPNDGSPPKQAMLRVPSVTGLNLREAAAILDNSGLRVGRIEEQTVAGARAGTIIAQLPQPGERVSPKTAVNLVVQISSSPHLLVDQILESLDWGNIAFEEIGDIMIYLTNLANKFGFDPIECAKHKIELNKIKYPSELVKGSAKKYTQYNK